MNLFSIMAWIEAITSFFCLFEWVRKGGVQSVVVKVCKQDLEELARLYDKESIQSGTKTHVCIWYTSIYRTILLWTVHAWIIISCIIIHRRFLQVTIKHLF